MKTMILLLSAAYLNGGSYADAGSDVPVGDAKNEITEARAEELIEAKRAEIVDDGDGDGDDDDAVGGESGTEQTPGTARRGRKQG